MADSDSLILEAPPGYVGYGEGGVSPSLQRGASR